MEEQGKWESKSDPVDELRDVDADTDLGSSEWIASDSESETRQAKGIRKFMLSILLVVSVGSAAYLVSRGSGSTGRQNLLDVTLSSGNVSADLASRNLEDIEEYIFDSFGVRVAVPRIRGTQIAGIGSVEAREGVSIPTLLIDDPQGDVSKIFVFTYSLLDKWDQGAYLERALRVELEDEKPRVVVTTDDNQEAVLWRSGDDIFVAVAEQGASRLISRIPS